ncbi:hypothetical protein ACOMHN_040867 [Nucella lapillus]
MTSDLCLLNDGTHTRVPDRADHGATAIDLTLVSSSLYGEAEWETSSELWGSDHLPISLLLRGVQLREDSVARVTYDYSNADWNGFQHLLATAVYPSPTDNIEICQASVTRGLRYLGTIRATRSSQVGPGTGSKIVSNNRSIFRASWFN